MGHVVTLIVALVVVMMPSVLATRLIGSARVSTASLLFTNPDGSPCRLPCLFGIQPGETSAEQAIQILKTHPLTNGFIHTSDAPFTMENQYTKGLTISFSVTPDGFVDSLVLSSFNRPNGVAVSAPAIYPESASVGDFASMFGTPQIIHTDAWKGGGTVAYTFLNNMVWITGWTMNLGLAADRLQVDNPVKLVAVFSWRDCPRGTSFDKIFDPWLGFTQKRRYDRSGMLKVALRLSGVGASNPAPCKPIPQT